MMKKFTEGRGRMNRNASNLGVGIVLLLSFLANVPAAYAQYPSQPQISKDGTAVLLEDYASLPLSSATHHAGVDQGFVPLPGGKKGDINFKGELARVTSMRSEPANAPLAASRIFVNDENGTLYILDKRTKQFTPYLRFVDIFPSFMANSGPMGLVSFVFDPDYAHNGKFYTVHSERPGYAPSAPTNASLPTLNLDGYTITPSVNRSAEPPRVQSVLIEWTDTNIHNATFEGTARELLRVGLNHGSHTMGDVIFNPLARPGDDDYGNLYVSVGEDFAGETPGPGRTLPQQLNTPLGKILRITPDINLRPKDKLSPNGRYRIPSSGSNPNPFVSVAGARGEIYAYGFRHPHRMNWDPVTNTVLINDIGANSWEEVDILTKGGNYGYAEREGNEQFFTLPDDASTTGSQMHPPVPFPRDDHLTVDGLPEPVTPLYPAAVYSHQDGDAIGSGFVYRGKLMPALRGKYIFNDISTGRIFYANLGEMIAGHGERNKQAPIHELQIMYKGPGDASGQKAVKRRMFDIAAEAWTRKGGIPGADNRVLPGYGNATKTPRTDPEGVPYGGGRVDLRLAVDGDGELYVLTKSDGMIRKPTAVVVPPRAASSK
jgi:hypothetical protein